MPKFNPPEAFQFAESSDWPEWKHRFLRFRSATKLNEEDGDVQVSSLIYAIGRAAERVFAAFKFAADGDNVKFDTVIGKFDAHLVPYTEAIYERSAFNISVQQNGGSVEAFIGRLYDFSHNCNYGESKDDLIRDRLIVGLINKELSIELQLVTDLTLDGVIQKARHSELVKSQVSNQKCSSMEEVRYP